MSKLISRGAWSALLVMGSVGLSACSTQQAPVSEVAQARCGELSEVSQVAADHLAPGRVRAVAPVTQDEFAARAITHRRTVGADLHVAAQPGVTAEYLERALTCHAASGQPVFAQDPLHPASGRVASVSVRSEKGGFAVRAVGENSNVGREIWNRAESYKAAPGVSVEQVASAESVTSTH